jgi:putative phosphoribosyl transferase
MVGCLASGMFADRADAGRQLAQRLVALRSEQQLGQNLLVLGLPRGGVVVAAEIARALDAPLDVLIVRKIGAPHQPELAIGAVTDGDHPQHIFNDELIESLGISRSYLESQVVQQLNEVRRRQSDYRGSRAPVEVHGRTVIVVDDGIATGATIRMALSALRRRGVQRLVLAVPVAPAEALAELSPLVDEIVCLSSPVNFMAVGRFYGDFEQTTDQQVIELLREFGQSRPQ